jgi:arylsulfatase
MAEAAKYNVLPLDDRFAQRADPNLHPSHIRGKTQFVYAPGTIRLGERSAPNTKNVHHTLAAEVEIPQGGAEGVLVCCGGISGGFALFIKEGKLHWEHNYYNEVHYRVSSTEAIPPGHHVLSADVKVDKEGKFGTGGDVTLRLGKKTVGEGRFEQQVAGYFTVNETFDVGCDTVSPVSDLYESPFAFTGTILRVMVDISETTFDDLAAYHEMRARLAMATQ